MRPLAPPSQQRSQGGARTAAKEKEAATLSPLSSSARAPRCGSSSRVPRWSSPGTTRRRSSTCSTSAPSAAMTAAGMMKGTRTRPGRRRAASPCSPGSPRTRRRRLPPRRPPPPAGTRWSASSRGSKRSAWRLLRGPGTGWAGSEEVKFRLRRLLRRRRCRFLSRFRRPTTLVLLQLLSSPPSPRRCRLRPASSTSAASGSLDAATDEEEAVPAARTSFRAPSSSRQPRSRRCAPRRSPSPTAALYLSRAPPAAARRRSLPLSRTRVARPPC